VRQVHYSVSNENSIDLVLVLSRDPTATFELKTDFTQSIADAIAQYATTPAERPKTKRAEPLLTFRRGALVHFGREARRSLHDHTPGGGRTPYSCG